MLKFYFDKPKTVYKVNGCLPHLPCVSPFHSLAKMMGSFKIYDHMTTKVYSCQDKGGGSTYPWFILFFFILPIIIAAN